MRAEHVEIGRTDAEAGKLGETSWTIQEQLGAGDSELQGGSAETAQDYLPAGEGTRPLYQWSQRPHAEGLNTETTAVLEPGGGSGCNVAVTCEIKSFWNDFEIILMVVTCKLKDWNYFEIISALYFTCNHVLKLFRNFIWDAEIISKLFRCFISHVTTCWNYCKIISATLNMLENIHERQ